MAAVLVERPGAAARPAGGGQGDRPRGVGPRPDHRQSDELRAGAHQHDERLDRPLRRRARRQQRPRAVGPAQHAALALHVRGVPTAAGAGHRQGGGRPPDRGVEAARQGPRDQVGPDALAHVRRDLPVRRRLLRAQVRLQGRGDAAGRGGHDRDADERLGSLRAEGHELAELLPPQRQHQVPLRRRPRLEHQRPRREQRRGRGALARRDVPHDGPSGGRGADGLHAWNARQVPGPSPEPALRGRGFLRPRAAPRHGDLHGG